MRACSSAASARVACAFSAATAAASSIFSTWRISERDRRLVSDPMSRAARACSVAGFSRSARSSCSMDSRMSSTSVVVVEVT